MNDRGLLALNAVVLSDCFYQGNTPRCTFASCQTHISISDACNVQSDNTEVAQRRQVQDRGFARRDSRTTLRGQTAKDVLSEDRQVGPRHLAMGPCYPSHPSPMNGCTTKDGKHS